MYTTLVFHSDKSTKLVKRMIFSLLSLFFPSFFFFIFSFLHFPRFLFFRQFFCSFISFVLVFFLFFFFFFPPPLSIVFYTQRMEKKSTKAPRS